MAGHRDHDHQRPRLGPVRGGHHRPGRARLGAGERDQGEAVPRGAWGSTKSVATFSSSSTYKTGYGTSITLAGSARVGVAWSSCTRSDCSAGSAKGVNIRWRESIDNMASWRSPVLVASYTYSTARRINDYPTAIMSSKPTRWIMYNVLSANQSTYNLVVEVGRGTP